MSVLKHSEHLFYHVRKLNYLRQILRGVMKRAKDTQFQPLFGTYKGRYKYIQKLILPQNIITFILVCWYSLIAKVWSIKYTCIYAFLADVPEPFYLAPAPAIRRKRVLDVAPATETCVIDSGKSVLAVTSWNFYV